MSVCFAQESLEPFTKEAEENNPPASPTYTNVPETHWLVEQKAPFY